MIIVVFPEVITQVSNYAKFIKFLDLWFENISTTSINLWDNTFQNF